MGRNNVFCLQLCKNEIVAFAVAKLRRKTLIDYYITLIQFLNKLLSYFNRGYKAYYYEGYKWQYYNHIFDKFSCSTTFITTMWFYEKCFRVK